MADEQPVLVFVPALVTVLLDRERSKGAPLTEGEVLEIRDGATCVALAPDDALRMAEERGHDDIVAEDAWAEWCRVRTELGQQS